MKKNWIRAKNNILYYWSVVDVAVTGFVFHIIHLITKRKRPTMMSKDMREELERLIEEMEKEKRGMVQAEESKQDE